MAVKPPRKRELFTPCPAGLWQAVWVDAYYSWDIQGEWAGKPTLKDYVHFAWEIDPAQVGTTKVEEVERPFWVSQRFSLQGVRYDTKNGKEINRTDYVDAVLRDQTNILPVNMDSNGEPIVWIGPRSNVYKCLMSYGGQQFAEAYAKGLVSFEKLVGRPCKVLIKHGEPDKDGQIWPRVADIMAPAVGQELKPSGHYIRIKDREKEEELPF